MAGSILHRADFEGHWGIPILYTSFFSHARNFPSRISAANTDEGEETVGLFLGLFSHHFRMQQDYDAGSDRAKRRRGWPGEAREIRSKGMSGAEDCTKSK
jgi:hypothetical protein